MGAYGFTEEKLRGLKQGIGQVDRIGTIIAQEAISAGNPVMGYAGVEKKGWNPKIDEQVILLDGDLVTSNVYTITLTLSGVVQTPVAVTFITDHDTTMDAMITALEAAFSGLSATITDGATYRELTIFYQGFNINAITAVVTLGAGQAGTTIVAGTQQIFLGIAMFVQKDVQSTVGTYQTNDAVNVLEIGWITVEVLEAVSVNQPVYAAVLTYASQGKFGTSGYITNAVYRENGSADGDLVIIEVRGQNEDSTK